MYVWLFKSTSGVSGLSGNNSSSGRLIAMRFRIETGSSTASWKWVTGTNKETSVRSRAELPFPLSLFPASSDCLGYSSCTLGLWARLISLKVTHLIWWVYVISGMTNCCLISLLTHLILGVVGVLNCTGPHNLWDPCSWALGKEVFWMALSLLEQSAEFFHCEQEEARV